jgi:hypothetical protein
MGTQKTDYNFWLDIRPDQIPYLFTEDPYWIRTSVKTYELGVYSSLVSLR